MMQEAVGAPTALLKSQKRTSLQPLNLAPPLQSQKRTRRPPPALQVQPQTKVQLQVQPQTK